MWIQSTPHVGVGGASRRVQRRHTSITDGRQQYGYHPGQDGRDRVAERELLCYAEKGQGRNGLNEDDAVENKVPKREDAPQAPRTRDGAPLDFSRSMSHGILLCCKTAVSHGKEQNLKPNLPALCRGRGTTTRANSLHQPRHKALSPRPQRDKQELAWLFKKAKLLLASGCVRGDVLAFARGVALRKCIPRTACAVPPPRLAR